jgi:trk system potassium uptake protein
MNFKLLSRLLGVLSILIGIFMIFSMPWAFKSIGYHTGLAQLEDSFESRGFIALAGSTAVCFIVGLLFLWLGRNASGKLFLKEAMAVVGLSWLLATFLGALPYYFSGTYRSPSVRIFSPTDTPLIASSHAGWLGYYWEDVEPINAQQYHLISILMNYQAFGLNESELIEQTGLAEAPLIFENLAAKPRWSEVLISPGEGGRFQPADRTANYRIRWIKMDIVDCLFESQSGFSTTGATVIANLEDPHLVPHCILFWRSSTHFLGGLGIIVLFVVILGHGSAGKALMRTEMPGPTSDGSVARMQHMAWIFAAIYVFLNIILSVILLFLGMSPMDAICHAFGTMATGGFSTFNASAGAFKSPAIEYVISLFMILAGTNFILLYFLAIRKPARLFADAEWQTYIGLILVVTALVTILGIWNRDFGFETYESAFRYSLFHVVSVMTTTGYGTSDFNSWNNFAKAILLLLMFVGACAGSTGGGMKVIRHLLFFKILWLEIERSFHPRVVRLLKISNKPVDDQELRHSILVYFGLVTVLMLAGWLFIVLFEPNNTWGNSSENKLIDSASAVAATLNNIGPGLGIVGATQNYGNFTASSKLLFVFLMMLGRLEIFPVIVLFAPRFWRDQ